MIPPLRSKTGIALCAVLLLIIALLAWQFLFRQSDVEKGLRALNAAYREQRPVEVRLSDFGYAPFVTTPSPEKVDQNELNHAQLTLLEALQKNPSPAVQHAVGKVYLAQKEFDKAIEYLDAGIKNSPNDSQIYADLGAAWLEKGKLDRDGAEPGKGMEELGRALENLNKALGITPNLPEALFNRALGAEQLTVYSQAENDWREYLKQDSKSSWAEEARQRLQSLEDKKKRAAQTKEELLKNFLLAYDAGNDDAAWAALSPSRGRTGNLIVESLLDDFFRLSAENNNEEAAVVLRKLSYAGEVEAAKIGDAFTGDLARTVKAANASQRERMAQARELMKEAKGHYANSDFNKAIEIFSTAGQKFIEAGDEYSHMFVEAWIGYCYLRVPESDKALQIFQRLSRTFATRNYKSMLAQALMAQADAFYGKSEFSKVMEVSNESFALSRQIQDDANVVRCWQIGTSVNLNIGDYQGSLEATFRALKLAEELPPDPRITWPFYHEASLDFYFLGLPASALLFENEALRIAAAANLPLQTSRSYDRLAVLYQHLGNYVEAVENSELARAQAEKINDPKTRKNVMAHAAMVLGRVYRESGEPKQAVAAFDTSLALYEELKMDHYRYQVHKGKMLALMQMNENDAAQAELDSVLYWFERNRTKIAEESLRDKFFDTEGDTYDLAIDFAYSRKHDEIKALDFAETSRARSLNDLMTKGAHVEGDSKNPELKILSDAPTLNAEAIKQRLPENTQLLVYAVLPDKTISWVITRKAIKTATAPISRDELNQKTQRYLQLLTQTSPNRDEVTRQAKELYTALIKPAESFLDKDLQLCIIPDDKLNFVPFVSLVSPDNDSYLIEDYRLQVAPSATVFITSSENAAYRQARRPERLLVVGNPTFDRKQFADMPDLPSARREAKEIAAFYGTTPLIDDAATVSRVKSAITEADVIHLATHAVSDNESSLLSKLLMATDRDEMNHTSDSFITAGDIYRMKLNRTRLVVLSACQTGVEKTYRGEGAIGLARPFIAAGVPLVVASLWPVESEATANLMVSFHKHRTQDPVSTAEALRRAQLEAIKAGRASQNMNYQWAAFVTVGGYANF